MPTENKLYIKESDRNNIFIFLKFFDGEVSTFRVWSNMPSYHSERGQG